MPRDCSWLPTSTWSTRTFTWVALPVTCWMEPATSCSFLSLSVSLAFGIQKKAALRRNLVTVPHRRPSHYVQANVLDVGLREVVRYFEFFCVKDDGIL